MSFAHQHEILIRIHVCYLSVIVIRLQLELDLGFSLQSAVISFVLEELYSHAE